MVRRHRFLIGAVLAFLLLFTAVPMFGDGMSYLFFVRRPAAPAPVTKQVSAEEDFEVRRQHYMSVCEDIRHAGSQIIMVNEAHKLAVCLTPKIGCTFWKRIMGFLVNETGGPVKSPFEINRYFVHHVPKRKNIMHSSNNEYIKTRSSKLTRVMFARDPFSRLWSAYVDKIILPDSWKDFGLGIYKYRNLGHTRCPTDIKFEDFLHFALFKNQDTHWAPLTRVCNPCDFHPEYVGKMETFTRDVAYILQKANLGHLVQDQGHQDHVEDEISLLIDYHYQVHSARAINKECLTTTSLAGRLWKVFKLNGYISLDEPFPETTVHDAIEHLSIMEAKSKVTEMFLEYYRSNPRTKNECKTQRQDVLVNAYKEIPLSLRKTISTMYKDDCLLFGYNPRPKHIFN